jgi:hypothetical protein
MRRLLGTLGLVLSLQLIAPNQLLAKPGSVPVNQPRTTANSQAGAAASGLSLNLASTHQSVSAALLNLSKSLYINVGGASELVNSTTMLTPAEYVAASQVASGSAQTLALGTSGNAVGGRMSLTSSLAQSLSNLVIPQGVKLFDNFASIGALQLSGNLIDAGKFVALSTSPSLTSAVIDANNIYVQAGGVLTSVLSAPHAGLNSTLSLSLDALNNVVNNGTISSSGSLSVSAGGSISNGQAGSMQAQGDVNLFAASGNFTNGGMVASSAGNINVNTLDTSNLSFNGSGGTLAAQAGAINFRNSGYAGAANLTLNGGNYLSQALNLNSGTGFANTDVGTVTGVVNTYAGSAHIGADTADLQMGVFDVSGDPFVWNNGGDLDLSGTLSGSLSGGTLSYLVATAAGSIYTSQEEDNNNFDSINTSGGNVVLAAGVLASDSAGHTTPINSGSINGSGGTITLTRSGMGGDIMFAPGTTPAGNTAQFIQGFSTDGGNVTLLALTNGSQSNPIGGHVILPDNQGQNSPQSVIVNTVNGSHAGSVSILAESNDTYDPEITLTGGAITIAGVNASGTGGNVTIKSETPNLAGATINDSTGAIAGSFDGNTMNGGDITIGNPRDYGATPTSIVSAGGSFTTASNGGLYLAPGNYSGTSVSLTTSNIISFWADVNTPFTTAVSSTGGALNITGGANGLTLNSNAGTSSPPVYSATGGQLNVSGGPGGTVTIPASTSITFDSDTSVNVTAMSQVSLGEGASLINSSSSSNWTLTAPTVLLGGGAGLATNNSANITIHTNNLNIGDSYPFAASIAAGGVLTIDDAPNGMLTTGGLTITSAYAQGGSAQSLSGSSVNINATASNNSKLEFASSNLPGMGYFANLAITGTNGVSMIAKGQITLDSWVVLQSTNSAAWTMTSPTIQLNDSSSISVGSSSLAMHTNALYFGDGFTNNTPTIGATGIVIDDNGSNGGNPVFTTTGLTIYLTQDTGINSINSSNGTLAINATAASSSSLLITSVGQAGGTLYIGGDNGVSLTAKNTITLDQYIDLEDTSSSGALSITAPTVNLNDGSLIGLVHALTIHTNSLNVGSNTNQDLVDVGANGITIDDNFTGSAGGVTLTVSNGEEETLNAESGVLSITAAFNSNSNVEFSLITTTFGEFQIESSNAVKISAQNQVIVDSGMFLTDDAVGGNWTITAPTVTVNNKASLMETGSLTVHTDNLNLGNPSANSSYTLQGTNGITIDDNGGTVFSTTGTLAITVADGDDAVLWARGGYNVNSSGTLLFTSALGTGASITFSAQNYAALVANTQVTADSNMFVNLANGSVTSPMVQVNSGAELYAPDAALYVHTNNLNLYNSSEIDSNSLSIDDDGSNNGSPVFTTYGLTITTAGSAALASLRAWQINATSNQASTLQFNGSGSTLALTQSVNNADSAVTANQSMSFGPKASVLVQTNASLQAPTVSLSDGALVQFSNGTISTNNLNLGDGANGNAATVSAFGDLTINDANMTSPGVTVTAYKNSQEYIEAGNMLNFNPSTNLSFVSSNPSIGSTFVLAGIHGVSINAGTQVQFGRNVTLNNNAGPGYAGSWSVTAPTVSLFDGSSINTTYQNVGIGISTNSLYLGNGMDTTSTTSITGSGVVSLNDNGMTNPGLTITAYGGSTQYVHAVTVPAQGGNQAILGVLNISSAGRLLFTTSSFANVVLDGDSAVNLTATAQIKVDQNIFIQNQFSSGAWTLTAPTVQLNDSGAIDVAVGPAALTVHTNTLNLGDNTNQNPTYLVGNGLTIDDVGFAANSGLTINAPAGIIENLGGGNESVSINAVNGSNDFIAFQGGSGTAIAVGGGVGTIALAASGSISLSANTTLGNVNTDTPWVVSAPSVKMSDGSSLNTTGSIGIGSGSASLAIHTNNLVLGDGSNDNPTSISADGLSIDDNGGNVFATTGLTITTTNLFTTYSLQAGSGTLAISTSADLLFTPQAPANFDHCVLTLDAAGGVTLNAGNMMTIQSGLTLENTSSSSNWTVTAKGVYIYSVSEIFLRNGATIAFTTNTLGLIEPAYPQELDLSLTNPTLNIPAVPSGVSIGQEAGISAHDIIINGQSIGNFTSSGQYDVASYSITIAAGNGTLTITPITPVTPAEWVAAEQVTYGTGSNPQTLSIGANNAASGGSFTVTSTDLPGGGFSQIVIPISTGGITMNLAVNSLQTNGLKNNGTINATQPNTTISGIGTLTGSMEIAGVGTINTPANGTITFVTAQTGAITIDAGTSQTINGNLTLVSPTVNAGAAAGADALTATGNFAVHTNALNLSNNSTLTGAALTVDDNGGLFFPTVGLTIQVVSGQANLQATSGALAINAVANNSSTLLFTSSSPTNGGDINLVGSAGVTIVGNQQVTVDQNVTLQSPTASGNWTITSPTVQLNDGATIFTLGGSTSVDLAIHTNTLTLGNQTNGNQTQIEARNITIDDNGGLVFSSTGLTVYLSGSANPNGTNATLHASNGTVNINATATESDVLKLTSPNGATQTNYGNLFISGDNAVNLTASQEITFDSYTPVLAQDKGNLTITAPMVQFNDRASLSTSGAINATTLNINTNELLLGSSSQGEVNIHGNTINISDAGMVQSGLTITGSNSLYGEMIYASNFEQSTNTGVLTISSSGSLNITSVGRTGALLLFDGDAGVNLFAPNEIAIDENMAIGNGSSTGNWTFTSPTVQFGDGSTLNTTGTLSQPGLPGANLTVHTNNLFLGDNSNNSSVTITGNNVTVDDNGGKLFSTAGLSINVSVTDEYIAAATNGNVQFNATAALNSNLLVTGGNGLFVDGNSVSFMANNMFTLDTNTTLANTASSGTWTVSAPGVLLNSGAQINLSNNANIVFIVNSTSGISQAYPSNLDLSSTNTVILPNSPNGVNVGTGAVISTTGTLTINTQVQPNTLGTGVYAGAGPATVAITGPNGSMQITTGVTPITAAEWIAADQVAYQGGQTLQIGMDGNGAATGGSFTVGVANVPSSGFNEIVIPSTTGGITMYAGTVIPVSYLENNGVIAPATGQTNVTITAVGAPGNMTGPYLEIAGTGTFNVPSGTVFLQAPLFFNCQCQTGIQFDTGLNMTVTGGLTVTAPYIYAESVGSNIGGVYTLSATGPIAMHTTYFELTNNSSVTGESITIDDNQMPLNSGLQVQVDHYSAASMTATNGAINFTATNGANDTFEFLSAYQSILTLDSNVGVNFTANSSITFRNSQGVGNSTSTGAWTLTAPKVQFNDGSSLQTNGILGAGGAGADLTIHTNYLGLGDGSNGNQVTILGNNVTVDDQGMQPGSGLKVDVTRYDTEAIAAVTGTLSFNATNVSGNVITDTFAFDDAYGSTLIFDAVTAVNMTATTLITFRNSQTLGNSSSTGAWNLTAPTIQFNDGATLETNGRLGFHGSGANLTIHTNSLTLGDNSNNGYPVEIAGNNVTVDDQNMAAGSGLQINIPVNTHGNSSIEGISATAGTLSINATNTNDSVTTDSVTFGGLIRNVNPPVVLTLDATTAVNITATTQISVSNSQDVINTLSTGAWTVTAPTVTIAGNASINPGGSNGQGGAGTSLTVHTNTLNVGAASSGGASLWGNSVTIDDQGMATGGLTVSVPNGVSGLIVAANGSLAISATNGSAAALSFNGSGSMLTLDATTTVGLTSSGQMTFGEDISVLNVTNSSAWTVTAPTVQVASGAAINLLAGTGLAFNVGGGGQITTAYPQNLDLSITNAGLNIPATGGGSGLVVASGASVSNNGSLSINDLSYNSPVTAGSYGASNYAITITVGSGTLTIGQNTPVTPAEWVAAEQVFYNSGDQTLNIGSNNAASGGSFTLGSNNLASGGFSSIVIPSTTNGVTMNVPVASVSTDNLTNNGTIVLSGGSTSLTFTSSGTVTSNLGLSGIGSINATGGTVFFTTPSGGTLAISDSTSQSVTGAFSATATTIDLGSAATINTISATGALTMQTNSLSLDSGAAMSGASVTISDAMLTPGQGLGITLATSGQESISASTGALNFTATNVSQGATTDSLSFNNSGTLILDSGTAVNLTATTKVSFADNSTVGNSSSTGAWTVSAPTVQLGDGSTLATTGNLGGGGNGANLTVQTNKFKLGDGSDNNEAVRVVGNAITVNDTTMPEGPGVTVTGFGTTQQMLDAAAGALVINAANGGVELTGNFTVSANGMNINSTASTGGNVTFNGNVTFAGGTVNVSAQNNIIEDSGTMTAATINLSATTGDIGASTTANYLQTSAAHLNVTATATGNGAIYINQTGVLLSTNANAGSAFNLTSNAATTLDNLGVVSGSISVIQSLASSGVLTVNTGAQITAGDGNITLENANTTSGAILIDSNARIQASVSGAGTGQVAIVIGAVPTSPAAGTKPTAVTTSTSSGGQVYFGTTTTGQANTITANTPANTVSANGANVYFNTGSLPKTAITLGGGDLIGSIKGQFLTSLDLDPSTTQGQNNIAFIQSQQGTGKPYGGTLTLTNGVLSGTLTLTPSNLASVLTAEYIPQGSTNTNGVVVTLNGFTAASPITVNLTASNAPADQSVVIDSTLQFTGTAAVGSETINSTIGGITTPVLSVGTTGKITSTGKLSLSVQGNASFAGAVNGTTSTIISTALGANGANGNISNSAKLGNTTGTTTLTVGVTGSFTQSTGGVVQGGTVGLTIDNGSATISAGSFGGTASTSITNLPAGNGSISNAGTIGGTAGTTTIDAGGTGSFSQTAGLVQGAIVDVTSGNSTTLAGTIAGTTSTTIVTTVANNGSITNSGILGGTAGTTNITLGGSGALNQGLASALIRGDTVNLESGTGDIGSNSNGALTFIAVSAATVSVNSGTAANAYVKDTATVAVKLNQSLVGGTFNFTSNTALSLGGTVTAGGSVSLSTVAGSSAIALGAFNVVADSGTVEISASGSGAITETTGSLQGSDLVLGSGTGSIGATGTGMIKTNAPDLSFNTSGTGSAYINDSNGDGFAVNAASSAAGGTVVLDGSGGIFVGNGNSVTGKTTTVATNSSDGGIEIDANLGSAAGTTTVTANGSGSITYGGTGTVFGTKVILASTSGSIGGFSAGAAIKTSTAALQANTGAGGSVYLNNNGAVTLSASTAGTSSGSGTWSLTSSGTITDAATLTAGTVDLSTANGSNGSITVSGILTAGTASLSTGLGTGTGGSITTTAAVNAGAVTLTTGSGTNGAITVNSTLGLTGTGGGAVSLTANGSGAISGTGKLQGNSVSLATTSGAITSNVNSTSVTSMSTSGSANTTLTISAANASLNSSQTGGAFKVTASNGLSVNNITASSINVIATSGGLTLDDHAVLGAINGGVIMQAVSTTNGSVTIGTGATIQTSATNLANATIGIFVGATSTTGTNTTTPSSNVSASTSGNAKIWYGAHSINAQSPTNTITADSANINFNSTRTSTQVPTFINLDGETTIETNTFSAYEAPGQGDGELVIDTGDDGQDNDGSNVNLVDALP